MEHSQRILKIIEEKGFTEYRVSKETGISNSLFGTAGKWRVDLDLMNRSASHQTFLFKDCSVMGEIAYCPTSRWQLHGKVTYDVNHSGTDADLCVLNGTELTMAGAGLEYYPILENKHALRLHANMYYSWGKNSNSGNIMQNRTAIFDLGVKWSMDLLSFTRK